MPVATAARPRTWTPERLDAWDGGVAYELDDDGRLIPRHMGARAEYVTTKLIRLMMAHVEARAAGWVLGGGVGLKIFPGRERRMPRGDVVFISRERLPELPEGVVTVAPNLIVEVVSPGDTAEAVIAKAHEYLEGGVELVWIVFPVARRVLVYQRGSGPQEFGPGDTLTGGSVLPGFEVAISDILAR